jgi:hypothetical protein
MTPPSERAPVAMQVLAAFGLLVLMALDWRLAAVTAVALSLVLPPARWRPAALGRALLVYACWAIVWVLFAAAYTRVMAALGRP